MPTILVTGSSGNTSSRLTSLLDRNGYDFLIASRKGTAPEPFGAHAVKFDYLDETTYQNPFSAATDNISAIYLVAPSDGDPSKQVSAFIDYAKTRHVNRFVLLSASILPPGGPFMGQVHQKLIDMEKADGTEWAAVRPTWFAENFSHGIQAAAVRDHSMVASATEDARIPFVSAWDIATVAYRALVDEKPHNTDHLVLGPEPLTYGEVATRLSKAIGRPITHKRNTLEEQTEFFVGTGRISPEFAKSLAGMDAMLVSGMEDRTNDTVLKVTGQQPRKVDEVFEENKAVWLK